MSLPAAVRAGVEAAAGGRIVHAAAVGGGCISPAARVETDGGARYFLKWSGDGSAPAGLFPSQADGLRAMAATGTVRVPAVIAVDPGWLLLEWLEPGSPAPGTWRALGTALAALHRVRGGAFGWAGPGCIGSLPQANDPRSDWPAFWTELRLVPQWERARRAGFFGPGDERPFERLAASLHGLLAAGNADGPSLIHGDLWHGNVHVTAGGGAALIDPSTYHGHREVDLAMATLFGAFPEPFFDAYREAWPLRPGYDDTRRDVYQLYYLLVHVNLFGAGYTGGVRRVLGRFTR